MKPKDLSQAKFGDLLIIDNNYDRNRKIISCQYGPWNKENVYDGYGNVMSKEEIEHFLGEDDGYLWFVTIFDETKQMIQKILFDFSCMEIVEDDLNFLMKEKESELCFISQMLQPQFITQDLLNDLIEQAHEMSKQNLQKHPDTLYLSYLVPKMIAHNILVNYSKDEENLDQWDIEEGIRDLYQIALHERECNLLYQLRKDLIQSDPRHNFGTCSEHYDPQSRFSNQIGVSKLVSESKTSRFYQMLGYIQIQKSSIHITMSGISFKDRFVREHPEMEKDQSISIPYENFRLTHLGVNFPIQQIIKQLNRLEYWYDQHTIWEKEVKACN